MFGNLKRMSSNTIQEFCWRAISSAGEESLKLDNSEFLEKEEV